MDSSKQDETPLYSPESSQASSTSFNISSSSYLTVPSTTPTVASFSLPDPIQFQEEEPDLPFSSLPLRSSSTKVPQIQEPLDRSSSTAQHPPSPPPGSFPHTSSPVYMSVYSAASGDSEYSTYSNPPAKIYRVPSFQDMSTSRKITTAEKDQMIQALRAHHVNTLVELRRIEKAFAVLGSPDVSEPMTSAWSYYVNSHSLLTELRGLTKNYPFSSECLEEAKRRVYADPQSNRSWNFCWLVLSKIRSDQLIPYYAQYEAAQPTMWGGRNPSPEGVTQLSGAFVAEWNWALGQMLRHWDQPPTR